MVGERLAKDDFGIRDTGGNGAADCVAAMDGRAGGIILAGMHSWGDAALESTMCRSLLPVACRPLIWHVARWLRRGGVGGAVVCGNSDTDSIRWRLGPGTTMDFSLRYYEDVMPRGPAGCMRDAAGQSEAEAFVVVESSILPQIDLAELLDEHRATKSALTLVVADSGMGAGHRNPTLEPVGIYVVSREALSHVPLYGYQDIKESLIPTLYASGARVSAHRVPSERTPRVTGAGSYLSVNMFAVEHLSVEMDDADEFTRMGDAWVHESATVSSSARLVGSVLVSAESKIGAGALIVGPTAIGRDSSIGEDSVVSRTIVWDRCTIGAGAQVDHSIITDGASVDERVAMRNTVCFARARKRPTLLRRLLSRQKRNGNSR